MGWLRGMAVNERVRCVTRPGVGLWWVFPAVLCRAVAFAARFPVFATRRWMRCFPMVRWVSVRGRVAWNRFVL